MNKLVTALMTVVLIVMFLVYLFVSLSFTKDALNDAKEEGAATGTNSENVAGVAEYLARKMDGYRQAALSIGNAYAVEDITCETASSSLASSQQFLTMLSSLQSATGPELLYTYVAYPLSSGTNNWGTCGCELLPGKSSVECSWVGNDQRYRQYRGSNLNYRIDSGNASTAVADEPYLRIIADMKKSDVAKGVWHAPSEFEDPATSRMTTSLTYSVPLRFDAAGKCILAAVVDIALDNMQAMLSASNMATKGELVLLHSADQGTFVADSKTAIPVTTTIPAMATGNLRVDTITSAVYKKTANSFLKNASYTHAGMMYNVKTVYDALTVIQRFPVEDATYAAGASIQGRLTQFTALARTLANAYENDAMSCSSANSRSTVMQFLKTVRELQAQMGASVLYMYETYRMPSSSEYGDCGCDATLGVDKVLCNYVLSNGTSFALTGKDLKTQYSAPRNNAYTTDERYVKFIRTLKRSDQGGVWHTPYHYTDPDTGMSETMVSFSVPTKFSSSYSSATATRAATIDVTLGFLQGMLAEQMLTGASKSEMIMIDTRLTTEGRNGTFVASSQKDALTAVQMKTMYPSMATPNAKINAITSDVWAQLGSNTDVFAFTVKNSLYNTRTMLNSFAIYERMTPAQAAPLEIKNLEQAKSVAKGFENMYPSKHRVALGVLAALMVILLLVDRALLCICGGQAEHGHAHGDKNEMDHNMLNSA